MARPLTPEELTRYPWASQISDYVPVGRLRKTSVLIGITGLVVLLVGAVISLVAAENIHHAVSMHHLPTELGVYGSMVLTGIAAVLAIVAAVQGYVKRKAVTLPWWTVAAIVPAILVFFVVRPLVF